MKKVIIAMMMVAMAFMVMSCSKKEAATAASGEVVELTLAHNFNDVHPVTAAYAKFAEKIGEATNGAYKISVYGNGQLGEQRANMELVQSGSLDMSSVYVGNLENVEPTYQVITSPYMFTTTETYREALVSDEFVNNIYQASLDKGFIGLVPMDAGTRNFYNTVRPIKTPADMAGIKFRVSESPTAIKMTELLGGIPVVFPAGETYTAIQQNLIHGGENNPTYLVSSRQAEVVDYFSMTQHTRVPDMLIMSAASWSKISPENQQIFLDVAREVSTEFFAAWDATDAEFIKEAKELGVEFNDVDDLAAFQALVAPMHEELAALSPVHAELIEYVRSLD